MHTPTTTTSAILILLGASAAPALAQGAPPPRGVAGSTVLDPSRFQRVDPTYDDTGPLRTSLRELSIDLRQSDNFSHVYRIPGASPDGRDDRFARRSGGITAVFPRSTYFATERGAVAGIPAGTIFYLDGVPAPQPWDEIARGGSGMGVNELARPVNALDSAQRFDTAVNTNIRGVEESGAVATAGVSGAGADTGLFVGTRALLERAAGG